MAEITFVASEYQSDQSFIFQNYRYTGSVNSGWRIERNGAHWLTLGPGYVPVQTVACGICSTDLARHRLPFQLPQITGHELVGLYQGESVVVEINASHLARGVESKNCLYCHNHLDAHCPDRMTLGIDRLPGGFSPWVLAPVNAIHKLPSHFSAAVGTLIEPFAAALKAAMTTSPREGDRVAVLGPRKLGMLLIAALNSYRIYEGIEFSICAVVRHPELEQAALELGADSVFVLENDKPQQVFDIVFDTTGNPAGFELAMQMAKREVHVKSTHGQHVNELQYITSMVINEQSLLGLNEQSLALAIHLRLDWPGKAVVYVSPTIELEPHAQDVLSDFEVVCQLTELNRRHTSQLEFAIVSNQQEIDALTCAISQQGTSLLRAGGKLLLTKNGFGDNGDSLLFRISQGQLVLSTSRCGSFAEAIKLLSQNPGLVDKLEKNLVTDVMPVSKLNEAFELASQSKKSIKVVVETQD